MINDAATRRMAAIVPRCLIFDRIGLVQHAPCSVCTLQLVVQGEHRHSVTRQLRIHVESFMHGYDAALVFPDRTGKAMHTEKVLVLGFRRLQKFRVMIVEDWPYRSVRDLALKRI